MDLACAAFVKVERSNKVCHSGLGFFINVGATQIVPHIIGWLLCRKTYVAFLQRDIPALCVVFMAKTLLVLLHHSYDDYDLMFGNF